MPACTMANSIGRRGGSGTLPVIRSPGGKGSLAVASDASGCCAVVAGMPLGAGLFAALGPDPTTGGALLFGFGQTGLPDEAV